MKIVCTLAMFFLMLSGVFAQEKSIFSQGVEGCYEDYYIAFHERGADPIPDGEHEVVFVVLNQGKSDCFMGKATVKDGKVALPVYIQKDDEAYVPAERMFKSLDMEWVAKQDINRLYEITDGMTNIFQTQEKYHIRLFFHTFIHPDHRNNKKAPPAQELLKEEEN
ncbi:hypothetical protein [Algoriphagus machipongonensis]|uniref:Lipoprotein n=1 Tax=Algoriphagus machipongonensis TaxID=388413 RepID=A3I218_9BACT|nr:hypothetical protein [Algoriphagus machipongonensis]EAZ79422.2 hypothetical protein ALPR1_04248 [Algoriphagus machipongonensis]